MPSIIIPTQHLDILAVSGNVLTVASTANLRSGCKGNMLGPGGSPESQVIRVVEVVSRTKLTVAFDPKTNAVNFAKGSPLGYPSHEAPGGLSAWNGGTLDFEEQVVYGTEETPSPNVVPETVTIVTPVLQSVGVPNPQRMSKLPDNSKLYVACYTGEVDVVDTATGNIDTTIAVGSETVGSDCTPDGTTVFVTNAADDTVSIIRTSDNTVLATPTVGTRPACTIFLPDSSVGYVVNEQSNDLTEVDVATQVVGATVALTGAPSQGVASDDGATLYVPLFGNDEVAIIDVATNTQTGVITGFDNPFAITKSLDGTKMYVSNWVAGGSISVVDIDPISPDFQTIIATIGSGTLVNPWFSELSLDGAKLYVLTSDGLCYVVDTATDTVLGAGVGVCTTAQGHAVVSATRMWVADSAGGADRIQEVDLSLLGLPASSYVGLPDADSLFVFIDNGSTGATVLLPDPGECEDGEIRRYVQLGSGAVIFDGNGALIAGSPTRASSGQYATLSVWATDGAWWLG